MNGKRWVAIGIAAAIFMTSILSSMVATLLARQMSDEAGFFATLWQGAMEEDAIIEDGDPQKQIAVMSISGQIIDSSGGFFLSGYQHQRFLERLKAIESDETIEALLLKVDTPGGGVYESAQIRDGIGDLLKQRDIPVYISMGSMAASGGYYISAEADKIFASEETLTGSIGVIMSGLNLAGLMEQYGIEDMTIKSGEHKDIGSSFREMTEEDEALLQEMIDRTYERFVDIIVEGRGMSEETVRSLADGRLFDGVQAKEAGLVDEIGYFDDALQSLKTDHSLQDARVIEYDSQSLSFFDQLDLKARQLLGFERSQEDFVAFLLEQQNPRLMYLYRR